MFKKRGQNEGSIRQRKDGKYEVRITAGIDFEKGTVKRVSFYANSKTEANKILKEEAYKFLNCNYVDVAKMTTYQYLKLWLKNYVKNTIKDPTYISYEGYVENHFKNTIGEIPLKKLNTHTIQELYNYKTETGLSAKTIFFLHIRAGDGQCKCTVREGHCKQHKTISHCSLKDCSLCNQSSSGFPMWSWFSW